MIKKKPSVLKKGSDSESSDESESEQSDTETEEDDDDEDEDDDEIFLEDEDDNGDDDDEHLLRKGKRKSRSRVASIQAQVASKVKNLKSRRGKDNGAGIGDLHDEKEEAEKRKRSDSRAK
ncbi:hypothetical protein, partial [Pantanalinema sp. GBBB05]|uniref:hypothetical protein n=1 Tax=Pantanalinema sp. GBBB05 TaxID=2604139 RepID=UPI003D812F38